MTAVASDLTNVDIVAANIANVNTVGGISSDVTTVSGINAAVSTVAANDANITTVASIDSDVTTVSGVNAAVTTVAGISADVTTAATNVTDITNFADVYYGPSATDPTARKDSSALQGGDLYFNTATTKMRVYDAGASAWIDAGVVFAPTIERFSGNSSDINFTLASAPGSAEALIVSISGVVQVPSTDFTVTGTTLTFTTAPPSGTNNIAVQSLSAGIVACSDTAFGSSWNGVTNIAPSKNAVYDKIESLPRGNLLSNSGFGVWSNSTVCEAISGATPVTSGANAALINNLLSNGGFDSVTTGWSATNASLASVAGGETGNCLEVTRGGSGSASVATATATTVVGKLYYISAYVKSGSSGNEAFILSVDGDSTNLLFKSGTSSASWVQYTGVVEAVGTSTTVSLYKNSTTAGTMLFDTVTFYEVTPGCIAADTLAFDGWGKTGSGAYPDIWRQHYDATYTKAGSFYSLKFTSTETHASGHNVYWPAYGMTNTDFIQKFAGRTVTLGCWVKADTIGTVKIGFYDTAYRQSAANTTTDWEWMEHSITVSASATQFTARLFIVETGKTAYFSQPMLVFGSSIGEGNYQPIVGEGVQLEKVLNSTTYWKTGFSDQVVSGINIEADTNGKLPKGCKEILCYIEANDSGSATTVCYAAIYGLGSYPSIYAYPYGKTADATDMNQGFCSCDASGDISILLEASGSATLDVYLRYQSVKL